MNSLFKTITSSKGVQENVVSFTQTVQPKQQKIIINGLELQMLIGTLEHEINQKQRVIVDIELDVIPNTKWREDDLNNVVSYADIITDIELLAAQKHIHLVETFAEMIIEKCFENPKIVAATVGVQKPDIIDNVASVGVKITRSKV
ncbi:MAG: dihydroneopterin aldolase [Alphaproteobacteria bacterium]|nr:dihydroneopterin aldolase [Alphaproteobacteria bacterium]